jgi:hypothetical protein
MPARLGPARHSRRWVRRIARIANRHYSNNGYCDRNIASKAMLFLWPGKGEYLDT